MISFNCAGWCAISHQTIPYLTSAGTTKLDHVTCKGLVRNAGRLLANNCNLEKVKSAGSSILEKIRSKDFEGSGSSRLIGCTIGATKTAGDLDIDQSQIENIQHAGQLHIENSTTQNVCHAGRIKVSNSKIKDTLKSCATNINIYNSQIKTLIVQPQKNSGLKIFGFDLFSSSVSPKLQTVTLLGKNCSVGSILFEHGCNGQVVQKDGAVAQEISHIK